MDPFVTALLAALIFGGFFIRRMRAKRAAIFERHLHMEEIIKSVLCDVVAEPIVTIGVTSWRGSWNGETVQVRTIVDTLATRKLPALWLSVTVNELVKIDATFDLMARPNSAMTFSNFEQLPHSIKLPSGYPEGTGLRTNKLGAIFPLDVIGRHLELFKKPKTKELLITPNGVRIVVLAAQADRARYGVFRQADFSEFQLDKAILGQLVAACSAIRADINQHNFKVAA